MTAAPDPTSHAALARRILDANAYLTLATADADGRPWATPVWFADRDGREFVWVSRTGRRHSHNIGVRPEVALAVFDSTTPVGDATAVFADAVAGIVPDDELPDALATFNAKTVASGRLAWEPQRVTGESALRLYRAVATEVWIIDEDEQRVPVR
ncbi:hypothetical protein ACVWW9_000044 [Agrococcus sp. UYP33]